MIRIIVADDEPKICQLICQLINWDELGMSLIGTASNGRDALRLIETENPDLVLTDIRMPGYDGMELLKKTRALKPELEFIIISGYSQFEYAQTAIQYGVKDYILKPIDGEVLNETLKKVQQRYLARQNGLESARRQQERVEEDAARLRETFGADLELNRVSGTMETINQRYHFNFEPGLYQFFMVCADVQDNKMLDAPYAENVTERLYAKSVKYLKKYLAPLCFEAEVFRQSERIIGIVNYSPEKRAALRDAFLEFISGIRLELQFFRNMQFHLSVCEGFESLDNLEDRQEETVQIMGQRLYKRDSVFLTEQAERAEFQPDELYNAFSVAIRQSFDMQSTAQIQQAVAVLEEETRAQRLSGMQTIQLVKDCYHLFLISSIFHKEYQFADQDMLETTFNNKVIYCNSSENLFAFLSETCQANLTQACAYMNREKIRPISQAKQYIQENYARALRLEEVSSVVGFSSSHFSATFHKETGKTFLEYLTDVRIEEAKTLLRESRMTVEMVCQAVGSNDPKRFSRTFRKLTGLSPKEYRNLYS